MAMEDCGGCGRALDARCMTACDRCGAPLCPECAHTGGGVCSDCGGDAKEY